MSRPFLSPEVAGQVLALIAVAQERAPEAPLAFVLGYSVRAAGESVHTDPPTNGKALAKIELRRG